jgi:hypothetical protein
LAAAKLTTVKVIKLQHKIGMICSFQIGLTADLYILKKEEISISFYTVFRAQADWTLILPSAASCKSAASLA